MTGPRESMASEAVAGEAAAREAGAGGVVRAEALVLAPAELDLATAEAFRTALDVAFASGADVIVADLSGTTFCDSSGIKVLVHAALRAQRDGRRFAVRGTSPTIRRTVDIVGATALLGLADE